MFVRLSSRSPKDAALTLPNFPELFKKELIDVKHEHTQIFAANSLLPPSSETNAKLHALYRASTVGLMVGDGMAAIDLLITSKRIQGDLETALQQDHQVQPFNVVVREFKHFDVKYEFRGFVYRKKFTALTQYNEFVYFPILCLQKDMIAHCIEEFLSKELILGLTKLQNYVVDFILIKQANSFDVYIVELNPFAEFAGGGLFSWTTDLDVLVGKKPFEFRIVTKPVDDFTIKTMYNDWANYI